MLDIFADCPSLCAHNDGEDCMLNEDERLILCPFRYRRRINKEMREGKKCT